MARPKGKARKQAKLAKQNIEGLKALEASIRTPKINDPVEDGPCPVGLDADRPNLQAYTEDITWLETLGSGDAWDQEMEEMKQMVPLVNVAWLSEAPDIANSSLINYVTVTFEHTTQQAVYGPYLHGAPETFRTVATILRKNCPAALAALNIHTREHGGEAVDKWFRGIQSPLNSENLDNSISVYIDREKDCQISSILKSAGTTPMYTVYQITVEDDYDVSVLSEETYPQLPSADIHIIGTYLSLADANREAVSKAAISLVHDLNPVECYKLAKLHVDDERHTGVLDKVLGNSPIARLASEKNKDFMINGFRIVTAFSYKQKLVFTVTDGVFEED
ncbi:hypothetical protein BT63DRAFT_460267 [Microthyrium microscopicum]|uniref:Uncharacterized protein n=1 Tax=Microthyrium microscopicum TaxID=703497 RepID=A0A6A6U025_9PEZI|nr:hypothetical protein BT63DRAFT_460267 [Microthyrium microscopicum]